jgi:hypothetical protein
MTFLAEPRQVSSDVSRVSPTSSLIKVPPVEIAMSYIVFFLLSPNPGALTATTLSPPLSLFTTNVARASLSMSSAIRTIGLCVFAAFSNKWRIY